LIQIGKSIRRYVVKYILRKIIQYGLFNTLNLFLYIFPKERYRTLFVLMQKGYLNIAYENLNNFIPKEHEKGLIERILSMREIGQNGLEWSKNKFEPIKNISVLFVVHNSLPFDKTGYAIRTHRTVKNLHIDEYAIKVVTRAGYPWDLQKHRDNPNQKKLQIIDGVEYNRLDDTYKLFKKGSDLDYISHYSNMLLEKSKENKSTILHAHSNYLNGLSAIKAAQTLQIPVVYEMRGLWYLTRVTLDKRYKHQGMYSYEKQMEKTAAFSANKVIVLSESSKQLLLSWGIKDNKIEIIPNSVDVALFKPKEKSQILIDKYQLENKIVLGFVGSLTGYEGLKELVKSVNELNKEGYDNIVLMIVGEGREEKTLKNITKTKNIIFTGRVAYEEVQNYYSVFDICPFPRNNFEVCQYVPPLKILEAMAMRKAIIVSDMNPLLEIIEDNINGLVCKSNDIKSLKLKILQLSLNKNMRERLANNAHVWVIKNRNKENITMQYKKLYNSFKEVDSC